MKIIKYMYCATVLFCIPALYSTALHIPIPIFANNPGIASPKISPDGTKIAYLAPHDSVMNIWIQNIQTSTRNKITDATANIWSYWWGYDNQTLLYFQDVNGNENWNVYAINLTTGITKNLTPFPGVQARFIGYSRKYPHLMLIGMNKEDTAWHDVYSVNIDTGELQLIEKNPGYVAGFDMEPAWYADENLHVRIAYTIDDNANTTILYRKTAQEPWKKLCTWDVNASAASAFLGFAHQNTIGYFADASETETARLIALNFETKEKHILLHDSTYDVIPSAFYYSNAYFKHPITHAIVAIFLESDTQKTITLDDSIRDDIMYLEQYKPGKMRINATDDAFEKWIVMYAYSNRPSQYYMYDRSLKRMTPLTHVDDPLLAYQDQLAPMEPCMFHARDGLAMHGYITYPIGVERTNLPVVVLVHGGPWLRDCWGFNRTVQFLANRGYVCLQINFRGSSGYGKSFVNASNKEFGRAMQYDLVDGVKWLIDQGIADPRRIAIMGRSYGGYAALAGAAFTPDVYACAIDLFGRSNLVTALQSNPPYWKQSAIILKERRGDPTTDESMLKERSPLFNTDKINIPLLVAHGAHDARIQHTNSDKIVEALRARGNVCDYILFTDEGHGFDSVKNKSILFNTIENFLSKYLCMVNVSENSFE